jgi:hypothetical protein
MSNSIATGVAYADPEFTTCYASQEIGYSAAAQGTVTQLTDKSTAVTLNKSAGQITMSSASLGATTNVTFTLNNSLISSKDVIIVNVTGVASASSYNCWIANHTAGSASITLRNTTGGALAEAVIINYAIIHSAN